MPRALSVVLGLVIACAGCRDEVDPGPPLRFYDASDLAALPDTADAADVTDADGPRDERVVRVATFNVHRLFDTVCDSGRCAPGDFEALPSTTAFVQQVERLAQAITALDADILLLQEIETRAGLDALQQRLAPRYPVAVLGEIGTPGSVDVGVLAAGRLVETRTHRDRAITRPDGSSTRFSREFLEVHVERAGQRVVVFAAHFRSMVDDDPGRRVAEGIAARAIVRATATELPGALVVLGGDLNDVPGSATITALEEGGDLHRVASELAPQDAVTYRYFGTGLALDHLYIATRAGGRYRPGTVRVVRDGASGHGGSDHAALRADFELR